MVFRIYVEKKPGLANEATSLLHELQELPNMSALAGLRLLNRYDVDDIDEDLFKRSIYTAFAEPQTDNIYHKLPEHDGTTFAVEYLPGQFDQRADSAAQCIQLISGEERPLVRSARIYLISGKLSEDQLQAIKNYIINPVESCESTLDEYDTLSVTYDVPEDVITLSGFTSCSDDELKSYISDFGLAMDQGDLICCRNYFRSEQRDPSLTELRVLDTYWSDHCRHTTFQTILDQVEINDPDVQKAYDSYLSNRADLGRTKPINLMDIATGAARWLKAKGILRHVDESPEINACTVKVTVDVDGVDEEWLLLFKNETHNHPTEIEPFGGAATCLGGAIRDPLSGRAYVYQAMRLTGAADPLTPLDQTLSGKLPQRKICTTAAAGYSSYGNQIGLATGLVDEVYHPGYVAKRMEIGALIGAAPAKNVVREVPQPGDIVILLGGKTGRDGCGGATGSSKSHDISSIQTCGAEVQKGNPPEERKIQRLFRNPEASRLIKRCNDFGAGGVSVAIGELADGLRIDLDAVPKKYDGLDGTELAISESQERMAVVIAASDIDRFMQLAHAENLLATKVAEVTAEPRLIMQWRGQTIVDLSRAFLDTNGSQKHAAVRIDTCTLPRQEAPASLQKGLQKLVSDLNFCSRRGLVERFDSTIGAGSVLMPFGGRRQLTPTQCMAAKIPVGLAHTNTCSLMSWGFDPYWSEASPFHGSYLAVANSVAKLVAGGADLHHCYLSFQEYFPKLGQDPLRWGKTTAALLGAYQAQLDLGLAAIGGKDSMSGTFEQLDVPSTLVSFSVATGDVRRIISPEFKAASHPVVLLAPAVQANGLPNVNDLLQIFSQIQDLNKAGKILAAYAIGRGGIAEALFKMSLGNNIGFAAAANISVEQLFAYQPCGFVLELADADGIGILLGTTTQQAVISCGGESIAIDELIPAYENKLEKIYPVRAAADKSIAPVLNFTADSWPKPRVQTVKPRFVMPAFPGTNCEDDTARAIMRAGGDAEIVIINNLTAADVVDSVQRFAKAISTAQGIVVPGGFSGGDEPDGSGKFITAFFRNPLISDRITQLLQQRDGLICGICNGFQALIKLGLVPFGEIRDMDENCPTLTFNTINRHQSKLVHTRIASNKSPWLAYTKPGEIYTIPISHGEGRFLCNPTLLNQLKDNGQIAAQYADDQGLPTSDIQFNPNGSVWAIEAITSPDGRVFGKMGHSERIGADLYQNVPAEYDMKIFAAAVDYFKK